MQKNITYTLNLIKLNCYLADESDADEIFIKHDGKKIWPEGKYVKIKDGSMDIKREIKVEKGKSVVFEIWDYDLFTPNDLLGTVTIAADNMGGPYTSDMVKKDQGNSRYSIQWEIN
ncbi:MAG: C2 domain-containing protein [Cyclobacteriaceae bacterium]|nr:C2 domain-containing protein [Cyclobacteriaceae bacterium]